MVDPVKVQKEIEDFYLPSKVKEGKTISGLTVKDASRALNGNAFQKLIVRIWLLFKTDKNNSKSALCQLFSLNNKNWYNEKKIHQILVNLDSDAFETLSLKFKSINYAEYTNKSLLVFKNKSLNNAFNEKTYSGFVTSNTIDAFKEFLKNLDEMQKFNLKRVTREGISLFNYAWWYTDAILKEGQTDQEYFEENIKEVLDRFGWDLREPCYTIKLILSFNRDHGFDPEAIKEHKARLKEETRQFRKAHPSYA